MRMGFWSEVFREPGTGPTSSVLQLGVLQPSCASPWDVTVPSR